MQLRTLPVDQLRPAPYNPRIALVPGTPEFERLERSLDEFGLVQPIVWNERTGHVVAGHQRLAILKHRGATEVETVVVSLPLEREQALNVTLNNDRVGSDWDPDKLVEVLTELQELPDFDATLTGFDQQELRDLVLDPVPVPLEPVDPDPVDDRVRVELVVPPNDWDRVRPDVDALVAEHRIELHVRGPE